MSCVWSCLLLSDSWSVSGRTVLSCLGSGGKEGLLPSLQNFMTELVPLQSGLAVAPNIAAGHLAFGLIRSPFSIESGSGAKEPFDSGA